MGDEDRQLIRMAQQDQREFGQLYRKYHPRIYRFLWHRVHDAETAADFMQETFLRALRTLTSYRSRGYSYLTYLLRISRNLLVDHWRRKPTAPLEQAERLIDPRSDHPDDDVDARLLWSRVESLSPPERLAIESLYRDRLPIKDIARRLHRSQNAVKALLRRSRRKLKAGSSKT